MILALALVAAFISPVVMAQDGDTARPVIGPENVSQLAETNMLATDIGLAAEWSPDWERLAVAHDTLIEVIEVAGGEVLVTLEGHEEAINSLAWSPDGSQLASTSEDAMVHIWDLESGELVEKLGCHECPTLDAEWSPDGRYLASGSSDRSVRIFDMQNEGEEVHALNAGRAAYSVAWSPDGQMVAGGVYCHARIWDVESGEELLTLDAPREEVLKPSNCCGLQFGIAFSPDGSKIVAAGDSIMIWDVENGEEIARLSGHKFCVADVAWSPNGELLAVSTRDRAGSIYFWDVESGELLYEFQTHNDQVVDLNWSEDGTQVATAGQDGVVRLWAVAEEDESAEDPAE
jgi:WD40 repeat protein